MSRLLNVLSNTVATTALFSCLAIPAFAVTTDVLLPPDSDKPAASDSSSSIVPIAPITQPNYSGAASTPSALSSVLSFFKKPADPTTTATTATTQSSAQSNLIMPTKIIKVPTVPTAPASVFGKGNSAVTITMPATPWTSYNANMVGSHLGIASDEVVRKCTPLYNGQILSDKGIYPFQASGTSANATYDGNITNIMVNVMALCEVKSLPSNAGLVMQIGDKYQVPLTTMQCHLNKSAALRTVQYTMDSTGSTQCTYQ